VHVLEDRTLFARPFPAAAVACELMVSLAGLDRAFNTFCFPNNVKKKNNNNNKTTTKTHTHTHTQ
jgi:hypothetical protein